MKDAKSVIARMAKAEGVTSDTDLAEKIGIARNTIASWKNRNSVPYEQAVAVAERKNCSLDWLLIGHGPMQRGGTVVYQDEADADEYSEDDIRHHYQVIASIVEELPEYIEYIGADQAAEEHVFEMKEDGKEQLQKSLNMIRHMIDKNSSACAFTSDEFALIKRLDIEGSAGPGAVVDSENVHYLMAFRKDWLRNEVGINPDKPDSVVIITAKGNSMDSGQNRDSDIHDGDLLLVDRCVEHIEEDAIYAIQVDEHLIIKRIQRLIDGSVNILSDNPSYDPQSIPAAQVDSIRIAGRIVFVIAGRKV
jgi:phage repressor protein C with HTH and peptisase S24 domain